MKILGTRSVLKCSYFLHTLLQQKCHGRHNHGSGSLIDTKGDAGKFWKEGAGWKGVVTYFASKWQTFVSNASVCYSK
jgi:hypothetical protein